ncbi:MAG: hypothetical protein U1F31_01990 [Steroidobacteraceae bacterium]
MHRTWYDRTQRRVRDLSSGGTRAYLQLEVRCVRCRRCSSSSIKDIAEELNLHWHTVKELEKQHLREQLRRTSQPRPKVIGIDEISIRKRHVYRIVVSDLGRSRPI